MGTLVQAPAVLGTIPNNARLLREPAKPRHVYLAGSYAAKDALRTIRDQINAMGGFTVVASWLDEKSQDWARMKRDDAEAVATRDIEEIGEAEIVILDTLLPSTSGGYHVELGVALSTGAVTYRVGPARNGFHYLVMHEVPDWKSLLIRLKRW